MKTLSSFLAQVEKYYSEKVDIHGPTPNGVDWNGEDSQNERFRQITKIFHTNKIDSVLDYGCGYGALLDFCEKNNFFIQNYIGYDLSEKMIQAAREKFAPGKPEAVFISSEPREVVEYTVSSGIFNVSLNSSINEWESYIERTLVSMDQLSTKGFSFNCLTSYSDEHKKKKHLYYANPSFWFDYCKRKFSRNVALLHDYDLYEFTILVRKEIK